MTVKSNVLRKLEENRGRYFSGEELALELDVTRASIWKAVNGLKEEGYQIVGIKNRGYCLLDESDVLSSEGIRVSLDKKYQEYPISIVKETISTNQDAKQAAAGGGVHGSVFLAEKQTGGRGRRGRSFLSMEGRCIYMSIMLKLKIKASEAVLITTAASVAVCKAIKNITGKDMGIKWVNDIYYMDKKICGILTEAVTDCETGTIDSVVLGIGINYNVPEEAIPEELKGIAGSIYNGKCNTSRNRMIAEILNNVFELCAMLPNNSFIEDYKRYSIIIGKEIYIMEQDKCTEAAAIDIDCNGGLIVRLKDNTLRTLNSGEITIRRKMI